MRPEKTKVLYILSGGHSGSTVLSLILGAAPEVFNAGELKFYSRHADADFKRWSKVANRCSCGRDALSCPFWTEVEQAAPGLEIAYQPGSRGYLHSLFARKSQADKAAMDADAALFRQILRTARQKDPSTSLILDLSKNLPRYLQLKKNPALDVSTIFMVRDGRGYLNSYRKRHQRGAFRWLLQWAAVNLAIRLTLSIRGDPFYMLSYDRFAQHPEKYLEEIRAEFGFNIPENTVEAVNRTNYHLRAGNMFVLEQKTFSGLKQDTSWHTELPSMLRLLSGLIAIPLNALFGV